MRGDNRSDGIWRWGVAVLVLLGVLLAACEREKGDPVEISRRFWTSVWTGNVSQTEMLSCKDYRAITAQWARDEGNPGITVDADHLAFEVVAKTDAYVQLRMSGVATFKVSGGDAATQSYDDVLITLIDESGWKVCAINLPDAP